MPTPAELKWGTIQKDGKTQYTCGPEITPNLPKIKCDLLPGWEHKASSSTGKLYYVCRYGNEGRGFTQWSAPTEPCTKDSRKKGKTTNANPSPVLTPTDKVVSVDGTPLVTPAPSPKPGPISPGLNGRGVLPLAPPQVSSIKKAGIAPAPVTPRPSGLNGLANPKRPTGALVAEPVKATSTKMHVTVQTANGPKEYNIVETPKVQAGGKSRYNRTRRNKNRNRSKKNRKNRNRNRN